MRALNNNERMLAMALGGVIFVIANLVAVRWVGAQMDQTRAKVSQLEIQIREYETLIKDRPYWEARQTWIAANPIGTYAGRESDLAFAGEVQRSVEAAGLEIDSQNLRETRIEGGVVVVGLELDVRGGLESMVRWLQGFQQPGAYVKIESFTLKRADAGTTMRLQVTVSKVFRDAHVALVQ